MQPNFDFRSITVSSINDTLASIKHDITSALDKVCQVTTERTFDNTVQPHINVYTLVTPKCSSFDIVTNFFPDKELRDFATAADEDIKKFLIDASMRKDVYESFRTYASGSYEKEKDQLTYEERRYFENTMRDFRRSGLHLEGSTFDKLKELKKELSDYKTKYQNNLNEENTRFEFSGSQLDGMPNSWFTDDKLINKEQKEVDDSKNKVYTFTLKYPDIIPGMKYIKSEQIRKQLWLAYGNRCAPSNTPLFENAVRTRYQIANLLGYTTHADFQTEVKIVKNADTALAFLTNLNNLFTPLYARDVDQVTDFAKKLEDNPLTKDKMDPWDSSYYNRLYQEKVCDIDLEAIKQYFPLPVVRDGMFQIYQKILGLTFSEVDTDNKWHPEVTLFRVTDTATNEELGHFYMDLHPREGKYSHAAIFSFINSYDRMKVTGKPGREPCLVMMACNFPANECLSFSDVETFFHEFGHVMHQICNRSQLDTFTGFGVEGDFVEAPSQMLEYWCYQKEPLQMMSRHVETGEPIPDFIVEKLNNMNKVLTGYQNKRQLLFGLFDLKVHMMKFDEGTQFNSVNTWYQVEKEVFNFESPIQLHNMASFGHLMGGYDAGYYGYLRSESYAANMFYKMFKENPLDPVMGKRYREKLLAPGSTRDGIDMLTDFLGEAPNDSYFLMDKGLASVVTA